MERKMKNGPKVVETEDTADDPQLPWSSGVTVLVLTS